MCLICVCLYICLCVSLDSTRSACLTSYPLGIHATTIDQPEWSEAEKKMAIQSYHQHPEHTIAIYVGNEDLVPFGTYTVDDLIGHMDGR
jgi:hypothetical protein